MSQRETLELLEKAREIISDESRWCKEVMARDSRGRHVSLSSKSACAWCASGAVFLADVMRSGCAEVRMTLAQDAAFCALANTLCEQGERVHIPTFNDSHTHGEVLALFDRAIARLREEGT